MPCYHPITLYYKGLNSDGNKDYTAPFDQGVHLRRFDRKDPRDVLVPCRHCIGCRLDYSRRWADRLMLELDHSKCAVFLTLTYDDESVTPAMYDDNLNCYWYTLVKKDLQDFNKRLRFHFCDKEIRFYAAGEYGDKTLRPHYHGIYYGLSIDDFPDLKLLGLNEAKQPLYTSELLYSIWKHGHVSIGNISWQSCAYVARYNLKKLANGNDDAAASRNCLPEFALMSRRPGIAGYFPIDHPEIFDNPTDKIYINDPYGVRSVTSVNMPKYIFDKLQLINPDLYAKIKLERDFNSTESFLAELANTDLSEFEYLNLKEVNHERRVAGLARPL